MAITASDSGLEVEVLHVLGIYKEIAQEQLDKYLGDSCHDLSEERMLEFWEFLEGRREWDGTPQIEEWYGALLLGPIIQLWRWIDEPLPHSVPSGMVFGRLVQIGLLVADATAKLEQRQKEKENGGANYADVERQMLSDIARRAVLQRSDQQLKPGWIEHCKRAVGSGRAIERLNDLLDVPGYNPDVTKIQPATLRRWATETGISFKPGRPKTS